MTIDEVIDDLRASIRVAVKMYNATADDLRRRHPDVEPLDMRDQNGRPILFDAHMTLLAARTALANAVAARYASAR